MTNPNYPPQPQPFQYKGSIVAEFVDKIPEVTSNRKSLTSFIAQPGYREAMEKARSNPGHAMLLIDYDKPENMESKRDSPSRRRRNAELRVESIQNQGFNERSGWTVKAVGAQVYVLYNG